MIPFLPNAKLFWPSRPAWPWFVWLLPFAVIDHLSLGDWCTEAMHLCTLNYRNGIDKIGIAVKSHIMWKWIWAFMLPTPPEFICHTSMTNVPRISAHNSMLCNDSSHRAYLCPTFSLRQFSYTICRY